MGQKVSRPLRYQLSAARSMLWAKLGGYAAGAGTVVHRRARVEPRGGAIAIGSDCAIHEFACLYGNDGSIELGDRVTVHPFAILYGDGDITIGDDVQIAAHAVIVSDNLRYSDATTVIAQQGRDRDGI